jgi:septal ring factor EnvC (AmiA/AmiB activator)
VSAVTPRSVLAAIAAAAFCCGLAIAQGAAVAPDEARALATAKREAAEAIARSQLLERRAAAAIGEAAKARAAAAAVAARIQAAEADLTAAETRIRIVEGMRAEQRARLAERQAPVVRLTAALQTMARRPPALALVQRGSVEDVVHVRSLLASTLPIIRARTAGLRQEMQEGNRLRRQARLARESLEKGQQELRNQRRTLAQLEERQRTRSAELASSALAESERALSFSEEARDLGELMGTREFQARVRQSLAALPGPALRPGTPAARRRQNAPLIYILPVQGRILTGTGEISDGGVHARGLTFAAAPAAQVVAPRAGRVVYAGRFRGYGGIVIIDHGGGWTSVITNLADIAVAVGNGVGMGDAIGRAGGNAPRISVELRRNGRPIPIAPLLRLG